METVQCPIYINTCFPWNVSDHYLETEKTKAPTIMQYKNFKIQTGGPLH